MSHKLPFIVIFLLFALFYADRGNALAPPLPHYPLKHKTILVLHSYAPDYPWTHEVNEGMMSVLNELDWTNTIRVEYMDSKNIFNEQYLQELADLYTSKYQEMHFDAILTSDNNALNFLEKYGRPLFPVAKIVAAGINGIGSVAKKTVASNVIIEKADHAETIRQAIRQNPEATTAYVIIDDSTTGQALASEIKEVIPLLPNKVTVKIVPPMAFEDLLSYTGAIPPSDFIYLLPYVRDSTGRSFRQGYVATFIAKKTRLPIYGSWEFQIGAGLVGGHVLSGFKQGEMAARTMVKLLESGESGELFPEPSTTYRDIYDYGVVTALGIPLDRLPEKVIFLNKPKSFYERHRQILVPAVTIIVLLSIFLLLLLQNQIKQVAINKKDRAIIALNNEIIDTQRELVTTLGEVIENHSRETGNHVKRVATISRLLGMKAGLSQVELEILEAASPMHDVGKIGISESILHKPGKLSDKEYEIIKNHTTIGRDILGSSNRQLLASACSIAYQHHERWDGSGYPNGLKGEEIDIFARITMLADIYDALSSERVYKKAWSESKVLAYIRNNNGIFFDPRMVSIFFENIDEIRAIRERFGPE